jgi:hypothetical protein
MKAAVRGVDAPSTASPKPVEFGQWQELDKNILQPRNNQNAVRLMQVNLVVRVISRPWQGTAYGNCDYTTSSRPII